MTDLTLRRYWRILQSKEDRGPGPVPERLILSEAEWVQVTEALKRDDVPEPLAAMIKHVRERWTGNIEVVEQAADNLKQKLDNVSKTPKTGTSDHTL